MNFFFAFWIGIVILIIYYPWFNITTTLSSGDWPYLFKENIREFSFFHHIGSLWIVPYYQITAKLFVQYFGLPWEMAERIFWFWPFILFSIFSSYFLFRSWIAVLIYLTNTYILMLVGGGQMGVAMSYSIAPLVLATFINLMDHFSFQRPNFKFQISNLKLSIMAGLVLAIQVMFDPRVTYVTFIAILLYWLFNLFYNKKYLLSFVFKSLTNTFAVPIAIAIAINGFWILPFILGKGSLETEGFGNIEGFKFLSFADFSHAFSLLHPNWPENIFGKTYFLQPEFLLLPILTYSSLLFISKIQSKNQKYNSNGTIEQSNNRTILFFALLGLLGAFLAKGVNEPFRFVNEWLFQSFPGMSMFRDPTKFYLLVVFSYSILIHFSVHSISAWINSKLQFKIKNYLLNLILIIAILYLIFLIRPTVLGQLGGTFKPQAVPAEYITLRNFIVSQEDSFNTLWVPKVQRFGFSSKINQAIGADQLLEISLILAILKQLQDLRVERTVKSLNIKYIVVPYDSQKEIFLTDRKYDFSLYNSTLATLQKIKWIEREGSFGEIVVFRVLK